MKKYAVIAGLLLVCATLLAGLHFRNGEKAQAGRRILYYVDPMHPSYKSDRPGVAPDCGMALEPVYADSTAPATAVDSAVLPPGTVHLSEQQQQITGIRLARAEQADNALRELRLLGRVAADEQRVYRINAAADGWILDLGENSAGIRVRKNQRLGTYFTPDLLTAGQSYVVAMDYLSKNGSADLIRFGRPEALANQLRNLGMAEVQLQEVASSHTAPQNIQIVSPVDGFVLWRGISPQQRFSKGAELYRMADLSRIWILADVYGAEQTDLRPGTLARITVRGGSRIFPARVSNALPQFDPASGSLKLRLDAENPGFALRPDMFVDVILPASMPPGLTVPADALLDSGLKKTVFVDRGGGYFEPRAVETGWQVGDRVQIVRGLEAGEQVVSSGTFLLDSESRLKGAAALPEPASGEKPADETQVRDPICGMEVERARAKAAGYSATYRGQKYYFCSRGCKEQFERAHEKLLAAGEQALAHD
ncbi:MAG TPA: efflux RND transporter periplasmic adaptor subunit [Terriglobales bacterium]|nr:efflux RND transporter periplasmic adaptor subunit [Terriglobales bacterium]